MFEYLEKLRKKSPRAKKGIAFLIAFSFSGIIFLVWMTVIYPNFKNGLLTQRKVDEITNPKPTSAFSDAFSSGYGALKDQFSKVKEMIASVSSAPVNYNASTTLFSGQNSYMLSTTTATTTDSMDIATSTTNKETEGTMTEIRE